MKCSRAREYICRNRDGALDESKRMELQRHLASCPSCAAWCGEMEQCMELIGQLPDIEPSEGFEWNLKRRIATERAKAMRRPDGSPLLTRAWGMKFLAGAAASIILFTAGAWLIARGWSDAPGLSGRLAERSSEEVRRVGEINYTTTGYPAGIRYVSDDPLGGASTGGSRRTLPFTMAVDPRMDYLLKENELLRRQVDELGRRNRYLQNLLREHHGREPRR